MKTTLNPENFISPKKAMEFYSNKQIKEWIATDKLDKKTTKKLSEVIAEARKQVKEGKTFSEKEVYQKLNSK